MAKPVRITLYNHKGGVGKTTLTKNIAITLAKKGRRVLIVDTDPQCNITADLIDADVFDTYLDDSNDDEKGRTIWSALKPVHEGTGSVRKVEPIETGVNGLFLVPGDIRLTEFETDLAESWALCYQRRQRGFRGTTAISELVGALSEDLRCDYVFYDTGPNIGPLNRVLLLDCDSFIVPVACDLFSLRALRTLGRVLFDWISQWRTIAGLAPEGTYLLAGHPVFLGFIPQGFRIWGHVVIEAQAAYLGPIKSAIQTDIVQMLRELDPNLAPGTLKEQELGEVKNFSTLVPSSQESGTAMYDADTGAESQKDLARQAFEQIAKSIEARIAGG